MEITADHGIGAVSRPIPDKYGNLTGIVSKIPGAFSGYYNRYYS